MPSDGSDRSDRSDQSGNNQRHLRPSGGYRRLRSFQVATLIYDATVSFCDRFIEKRSRTHDQMVQAARSGRQNIAEGSRAAATSSQTELRLTNIARASLDELLLDYEDFLRQHALPQWPKDAPETRAVRSLGMKNDSSDRSDRSDPSDPGLPDARYTPWIAHKNPAVVANTVICLIHQANYLLDQQIAYLEGQFIHDGGYTEQLAAARILERKKQQNRTDRIDPTDPINHLSDSESRSPACPRCGKPMVLRTARTGAGAGSQFWGCSSYPSCTGTRKLDNQ